MKPRPEAAAGEAVAAYPQALTPSCTLCCQSARGTTGDLCSRGAWRRATWSKYRAPGSCNKKAPPYY
eukprot:scaffold65368_cov19-Tisochrysis_lutea.AAC.3